MALCSFSPQGESSVPVRLNETLTNQMSDIPELAPMDAVIDSFRQAWNVKGLTLAVMRNDSLLYAKGYGWADIDNLEPTTPGTTMRLASVSKLLTAIAIMELIEEGRFSLRSPVFGPFGVLKGYDDVIQDDRHFLITVEHLLRHESGLYSGGSDPMFEKYSIMRTLGLNQLPDQEQLSRYLLAQTMDFDPGTSRRYSNFGYLLLGMIIEQQTGKRYADYMQEEIFQPNGCFGFAIAGNYISERRPGETIYYPQNYNSRYGSPCYSGDIRGLGGGGAWTGSAPELARLVATIDGRGPIKDILSKETLDRMALQEGDDGYPLGWIDSRKGVLTRSGTLHGTSTIIRLYPDGECWVMLSNTSTSLGSRFSLEMGSLFANLRSRYGNLFPARDMFSGRSGR